MAKHLEPGTQAPMLPSSAIVDFAATNLLNTASATWYQGTNAIIPGSGDPVIRVDLPLPTTATRAENHPMDARNLIAINTTTHGITLQPGIYNLDLVVSAGNVTTAGVLKVALTDDVSSGSTVLFFQDETVSITAVGSLVVQYTFMTTLNIATATTICLRMADNAAGTIIASATARVTRIGNIGD